MKGNTASVESAARTNIELMHKYSETGLPIFKEGLSAVRGRLAVGGLDRYVNKAYAAAGTSAEEAVNAQERAAIGQVVRSTAPGGARLGAIASIYAGGAKALAQERAGIQLAKAKTEISDREQLIGMLAGGGFQATDLAAGFGGLTNRSLSVAAQAGNPIYEGVVGGVAAGSQLALTALTPKPIDYGSPLAYNSFMNDVRSGRRTMALGIP